MNEPPRDYPRPHAPRPSDLVALVSFDGKVYENLAVTRDRLTRPAAAPHALTAAISQWLTRRHTWIDVRGRQIEGIATARELSSDSAWEIDTLVDASDASDGSDGRGGGVVAALLDQAARAAAQEGVTHIVLRTPVDSPAVAEAVRAGFRPVLIEQLWHGRTPPPPPPDGADAPAVEVRPAQDGDAFALFQLYNRALPFECRQALAATLQEWEAVQERRWLGRGGREFVATTEGTVRAALRLASDSETAQFDLLAGPDEDAAAAALLRVAWEQAASASQVVALLPQCAEAPARWVAEHGLTAGEEYALLCRRVARPVTERPRVAAGVAVSRG